MIAELRKELGARVMARLDTAALIRGRIKFLEQVFKGKRKTSLVRWSIGLYNGHKEATALRRLRRMPMDSSERLEVRIAGSPRSHLKGCLFTNKRSVTVFWGSSHLAGDGLGPAGRIDSGLVGVGHASHITRTWSMWSSQ